MLLVDIDQYLGYGDGKYMGKIIFLIIQVEILLVTAIDYDKGIFYMYQKF